MFWIVYTHVKPNNRSLVWKVLCVEQFYVSNDAVIVSIYYLLRTLRKDLLL